MYVQLHPSREAGEALSQLAGDICHRLCVLSWNGNDERGITPI